MTASRRWPLLLLLTTVAVAGCRHEDEASGDTGATAETATAEAEGSVASPGSPAGITASSSDEPPPTAEAVIEESSRAVGELVDEVQTDARESQAEARGMVQDMARAISAGEAPPVESATGDTAPAGRAEAPEVTELLTVETFDPEALRRAIDDSNLTALRKSVLTDAIEALDPDDPEAVARTLDELRASLGMAPAD